ncbi:MAG: HlyD family secretion protein [Rhodospirillaceae bacterium]|jgi:membrane fusion protein (multidrug efflux system)|nr:HlyD family secretion protein [Rhodospirillaceae bacterium]MBT3495509.1 HlyD family secretion protein [Rhodospirillaceae bacterium]MBT3780061.1 HlyD family secretion protein [Rhodospirillaceae bacterium]MBT3975448.1 HlyD family secretion protein [Rhodospirillaceae bacterium]MBT4171173.1 HlyD family secretion protein [Rhodospirillaceae bacterium]
MAEPAVKDDAMDTGAPAGATVSELPSSTPRLRRRWIQGLIRFFLMLVVPIVGILYGAGLWAESLRYIGTENAYVKSHVVAVSADISGRVVEINARDNQAIKKGDVLFRIDPHPFQLEVDAVLAQLDGVRLEIQSKRMAYRAGLQGVEEDRESVRYMKQEYGRATELTKRGVGTTARRDAARHDLEMAKQQLKTRKDNNQMVLAELGGNPKRPAEDDPEYQKLVADYGAAQLDLERTVIRAPTDGTASNVKLRLGEYVRAGTPVFAMVESGDTWVEANLKETQLTHVLLGQKATVVADAFPDNTYNGVIESISPATGAEFALLPPQNASGNWVKVVQRIPVRLRVTGEEGRKTLRAGMTVTVTIDSERERSLGLVIHDGLRGTAVAGVIPDFILGWLAED